MRTRIMAVAIVASLVFILPYQHVPQDAAAQSKKTMEACDESLEALSNPCQITLGETNIIPSGSCCGDNRVQLGEYCVTCIDAALGIGLPTTAAATASFGPIGGLVGVGLTAWAYFRCVARCD